MKKGLDATSIVMIVLFCAIMVSFIGAVIMFAVFNRTPEQQEPPVVQQPPEEIVETYETAQGLVDKFKEICLAGDVDALYKLYYDDYLTLMRENSNNGLDKSNFEMYMKQNMMAVTQVDFYEYGTVELPATQPPGTYASYMFGMSNNGLELPLKPELIEDCAAVEVYSGSALSHHFAIKVDGSWYFMV